MITNLIQKEIRSITLSPKFTGTFIVCTLLILLSIYTGIKEYQAMNQRYYAASQLVDEELKQATSWGSINTRIYRQPDPLQIFTSGLDYDIGRWTPIANDESIKFKNSAYADDPIFAVFRFIDFAFIVQYILTLFAILFTYNAVSGEREDGTLKLVFSNSISRVQYLIGKIAGAWLSLIIPISIPILLGILLLLIFDIPLALTDWLRIGLFLDLSLVIFTFFIALGILISTLSKRSSVSFLIGLVVWVLLVMIIPRAGIMAAGQIVYVPRVAEIEGQLSKYSQQLWDQYRDDSSERWSDAESQDGEININDEALWAVLEREDSLQSELEKEIHRYDLKLHEDLRQRKIQQQKLAFALSCVSPVAAYQIAAMSLAGTDTEIKQRYEDAANTFRSQFYDFVEMKKKTTGDLGRIMMSITMDDQGNQQMATAGKRNSEQLDISGLPYFDPPRQSLAEAVKPAIIPFGLILLYSIVAFGGATALFIRYDVR
jgi:ABC-type transport system involved in multi-copper enzyme maturation permease subunit